MVAEDAEALELQRTLARAGLPCWHTHRVGSMCSSSGPRSHTAVVLRPDQDGSQAKAERRGGPRRLERIGTGG